MKLVYDMGMFDASDTIYYLEEGFRVIAVEANPALVDRAKQLLGQHIDSGNLILVNAAISANSEPVKITICGDDLGSSSTIAEKVASRTPIGCVTVPGITTEELLRTYGSPFHMKIDLEGVDGICVRALSKTNKPAYLSFEAGHDMESLAQHLVSVGYEKFKLISQITFREFANRYSLRDRIARKIVRLVGYAEPRYVKRNGRLFSAAHSSGPAPWCSDGKWSTFSELITKWGQAKTLNRVHEWYDVHAV